VVADSLVLRNRQLLVAAKRYLQAYQPTPLNRLTKKIKKTFVI